jgi:hypothetical protein
VARTKANKLMMTIPEGYRGDFLSCLDRSTPAGQAMHERLTSVIADLGGDDNVATVKRSTARDWACLDVLVESVFCRAATGEKIDIGALNHLVSTKLGAARLLGLERRARTVRTLRQVMDGAA